MPSPGPRVGRTKFTKTTPRSVRNAPVNKRRAYSGTKRRRAASKSKGGGFDLGAALSKLIPSRNASGTVSSAMRNAPKSRDALRKSLGK